MEALSEALSLILSNSLACTDEEKQEDTSDEEEEDGSEEVDEEEEEGELADQQEQRRGSHREAGPASGSQGEAEFYAQTPDGTKFSASAFSDLHLSRPLLKACAALGYTNPTPIQVRSM